MGEVAAIQDTVLERHRARRTRHIPTLTVLVGDRDAAGWYWQTWSRAQLSALAVTVESELSQVLRDWLSSGDILERSIAALEERAARAGAITVAELRARVAAHEIGRREQLVERLAAQTGLCHELVSMLSFRTGEALHELACRTFPRVIADLERLLPQGLPALFCAGDARHLAPAISTLLSIAEAVPRADIALAATAEELANWKSHARAREWSLVREGIVRLEPRERPAAGDRAARERTGAPLTREAPLVQYDAADYARSRAERTLYEHLETRARTRGVFALNRVVPDHFDGRRLEVDLLAEGLHLAVEIDGYHHFRDAAAYRRDRHKDIALQQLGYTVVRVLASDVEDELAYVVDTIDRAIEHQLREKSQ